jgi:hypothetical protein
MDDGEPAPLTCDEPVTPAGNTGVRIMDLREHHCRWVIGPMRYCGERKRAGSSFCPDHHKICWRPRPVHGSIQRKV